LNDRTLELGKHPKHLEHGLTTGCRCVDPLLVQEEVDAGGGAALRRARHRQVPYP
jgi:hypothetical protein